MVPTDGTRLIGGLLWWTEKEAERGCGADGTAQRVLPSLVGRGRVAVHSIDSDHGDGGSNKFLSLHVNLRTPLRLDALWSG